MGLFLLKIYKSVVFIIFFYSYVDVKYFYFFDRCIKKFVKIFVYYNVCKVDVLKVFFFFVNCECCIEN